MPYLLDSDVVIDFLRQKDPGLSLVNKVSKDELYISVITVITWMEILYGIKKAKLSQKRFAQFGQFLQDSNIDVIPVSKEIGTLFIDLKVSLEKRGEKLADFDLLIASTARRHKLILITRNTKHFDRSGIKILKA